MDHSQGVAKHSIDRSLKIKSVNISGSNGTVPPNRSNLNLHSAA